MFAQDKNRNHSNERRNQLYMHNHKVDKVTFKPAGDMYQINGFRVPPSRSSMQERRPTFDQNEMFCVNTEH